MSYFTLFIIIILTQNYLLNTPASKTSNNKSKLAEDHTCVSDAYFPPEFCKHIHMCFLHPVCFY